MGMEPLKNLKSHNFSPNKYRGDNIFDRTPTPFESMVRNRWYMEIVDNYVERNIEIFVGSNPEFIYEISTANNPYHYELPLHRELTVNFTVRDFIYGEESFKDIIRSHSDGLTHRNLPQKFNTKFMELDPTGITISEKKCYGCLIKGVDFGTLDNFGGEIKIVMSCDYFDET